MIPVFPKFKLLTIKDKEAVKSIIAKYPPYSDFSFVSLWSWSIKNNTFISILNNNLVILFSDYITNERFYSLLGSSKIPLTVDTLLHAAKVNNYSEYLKVVPESVILADPDVLNIFDVKEERDHFDYIYLIDDWVKMRGKNFGTHRNFIKRFVRLYNPEYKILPTKGRTDNKAKIFQLFHTWRKSRGKKLKEIQNELRAMERVIKYSEYFSLVLVGIFIKDRLVGFSVNEFNGKGYVTNLFEKADMHYPGIFYYVRYISATYLQKQGCIFLNHEQDLGIPGLRKAKMNNKPAFFLKKYSITLKNN